MSFGAPRPPPPPNPYAVAQAQQMANISVAIANSFMANANVVSPEGTSTFTQSGSYLLSDPQYDASGNLTGTTTRTIPIFTQTVALSTVGQQIFDSHQSMQLATNRLGVSQIGFLADTLGTPFTLSGLPPKGSSPTTPTLEGTVTISRAIQATVGAADTSADKEAVIQAILSRLEYQSTFARANRITELANSGIFPGSEAYANEMQVFDFQVTDGRLQAILAGGQEQTRQFQIDLAKGQFYNAAIEQEVKQQIVILDFANSVNLKRFQALMQIADFINTFRERALQETLTARNQPLNELSTMLRGGQIAIPSFTGFKAGTISDTPLASSVYASANLAQRQYEMKVSQQNAMIGGLASLGGAILSAPATGGGSIAGSLAGKLLGNS